MFKKPLLKSLAATAVAGTVLAAAQAGPAVTTAAPQIENRALVTTVVYPDTDVRTVTNLSLRYNAAQYGERNRVYVRVSAPGTNLTPTGRVMFTLDGRALESRRLSGGTASLALPRTLPARESYEINASYRPSSGSNFVADPNVPSQYYSVFKVGTTVSTGARDIEAGQQPRVNGSVVSPTGITVTGGQAQVQLIRKGRQVRAKLVDVRNGSFSASFPSIGRRGVGSYSVKSRYLGTGNFRGDGTWTRFSVAR
jgi:hypothetical protein